MGSGFKKSCYLLDMEGNIVGRFSSRTEVTKYLGLSTNTYITRLINNPKARVKSKVDLKWYRVADCQEFDSNR